MHVNDDKDGIAEAVSGEDQDKHVQSKAELNDNVESKAALSPTSPPIVRSQGGETPVGPRGELMTEKGMRDNELAKSSYPSNEILHSSNMKAKEVILKTKINFKGTTLPLMAR